MDEDQARVLCAAARVARLATVGADGQPHLVPVTFAARNDVLVIAIDHKPKRSTDLKRLRNIEVDSRVCVLVDHYDDQDWSHLWWVRADGTARILQGDDRTAPVSWLVAKYSQYLENPPAGPVIWIDVSTWRGWVYA